MVTFKLCTVIKNFRGVNKSVSFTRNINIKPAIIATKILTIEPIKKYSEWSLPSSSLYLAIVLSAIIIPTKAHPWIITPINIIVRSRLPMI